MATMDDNDTTSAATPCDQFEDQRYKILSGFRAFSALFSLICCLLVITLIFLFKRHHYFLQRLVIYVCTIAAINSLVIAIQKLDYATRSTELDKYCIFAGFLEYYTSQVELIGLVCITHGLYRTVFKQKPKKYLEFTYIALSVLGPILLACIPIFGHSGNVTYGKSGPWCWIEDRFDNCDKNYFGIALQFILWYTPLLIVTVITVIVYVVMFCKVHKSIESHWQGPYDPELSLHKGRLRKVVKILLAYIPLLYLVINLFSLPNAIQWAIADEPLFPLWVFHGVFPPLRGALFALPYLFHTDTRQQIKQISVRATIKQYFMRNKAITSYPAKECNFSDSLTFPGAAETTYERNKPYRNPSLRLQLSQRYSIPTVPQVETINEDKSVNVSTQVNASTQLEPSGLLTSRTAVEQSECESTNQQ